jgi:hypothetical protein
MLIPTNRLKPFDPESLWSPRSFKEWAAQRRLMVFLQAWEAQADQERILRGRCAWMIFSLALFQSGAGAALLVAIGLGKLTLEANFLKILYSALLTEVFGLFFVLTRYLFSQPAKYTMNMMGANLEELIDGEKQNTEEGS